MILYHKALKQSDINEIITCDKYQFILTNKIITLSSGPENQTTKKYTQQIYNTDSSLIQSSSTFDCLRNFGLRLGPDTLLPVILMDCSPPSPSPQHNSL